MNNIKNKDEKPIWRKFVVTILAIICETVIGLYLIYKGFNSQVVWVLLSMFVTVSIFVGGNVAESYVDAVKVIFGKGKKKWQ